uniref:Apple domain-containing protein n=1 Tax=Acrobeloides nanus TaxID=290746 RepID=A0A914BZU3_9BILA
MFIYLWKFAIFIWLGILIWRVDAFDEDALKPCFERYDNAKITDAQPFHSEWRMKNEEHCLKFCAKTTSRCKSIVYDRYSHVCHYFMISGVESEKIIKSSRMTYFELVDPHCAVEKMLPVFDHEDFEVPEEQSIPSPPIEIGSPSELQTLNPSEEPITEPITLVTEAPSEHPVTEPSTTLGPDETVYYPDQAEQKPSESEAKPLTYEDYQDLLNSLPDYDHGMGKQSTTPKTEEQQEVLIEPIQEEVPSTMRPRELIKELEPIQEEVPTVVRHRGLIKEIEPEVEGPILVDENENPIDIPKEEDDGFEKNLKVKHKSFQDFKPVITHLTSELEGAAILPAMNVFKASQLQQKPSPSDSTEDKLEKILKNEVEIRRRPVSKSSPPKEQISSKDEAYLALIRRLVEKLDQLPEKEPERVQVQQPVSASRPRIETRRKPIPKSVPSLEKIEAREEIEPIVEKSREERPDPVLVRPNSMNERLVMPIRSREIQKPRSAIKLPRPKAIALVDDEREVEPIIPIPLRMMENSKLKMKIEKTQDVELITESGMADTFGDEECPRDSNHVWVAVENSKISETASQALQKTAHTASDCMEICNNLMVDSGTRCNSFTFNEVDKICKFYSDVENISVASTIKNDFKTRAFRRLCYPANLSPFYQCSEFLSFREFSMNTNPREEFEGLPSNITGFSACVELCVLSPDFKCLSGSFDFVNQKCRIYDQNSISDPDSFKQHSEENMLYFENGCQNQEISQIEPENASVQRVQQRLKPVKIDFKRRVKRV